MVSGIHGVCALPPAPAGGVPGRVGLVFERVDPGESLDVTRFGGGASMTRTVSLALGVARGLAHAHRAGIMHRDVKPSNVLVAGGVEAKICDWGLAVDIADADKAPDTGTNEYMAPEVHLGGAPSYGAKADVFSFGVLMYALGAKAQYPHQSTFLTPDQVVVAVAERGLRPALRPGLNLDPAYVDLMQRCWAAAPADRPTMEDAAVALYSLLDARRSAEQAATAKPLSGWGAWLGL